MNESSSIKLTYNFQVVAVAILIMRFPEKCGRVSAVNESALGLGFAMAPFVGGIFHDKCTGIEAVKTFIRWGQISKIGFITNLECRGILAALYLILI